MSGPGYNTFHGADTGPPPPGMSQQPYGMYSGPPPQYYAQQPPPGNMTTAPWQMYQPGPLWTNFAAYYGTPTNQYAVPGANPYMPAMPINNEIPGLNFRNPSGGIGLPPGYNYLFPPEHTVIHVFKPSTTKFPPWQQQMNPLDPNLFFKLFAPTNLTMLELVGRLGLDNPEAKMNVIHEVVEKGNGAWAKGMTFKGDDKDRMKLTLKQVGWDSSRIGVPGRKAVVWLYITKK